MDAAAVGCKPGLAAWPPPLGAANFVELLPSRPSLEMQQRRAKNLLRTAASGAAEALERIRALHPKPPAPGALNLADAHLQAQSGARTQ